MDEGGGGRSGCGGCGVEMWTRHVHTPTPNLNFLDPSASDPFNLSISVELTLNALSLQFIEKKIVLCFTIFTF